MNVRSLWLTHQCPARAHCFLRLSGEWMRKVPSGAKGVAGPQPDHRDASVAESTVGPERLWLSEEQKHCLVGMIRSRASGLPVISSWKSKAEERGSLFWRIALFGAWDIVALREATQIQNTEWSHSFGRQALGGFYKAEQRDQQSGQRGGRLPSRLGQCLE